MPELSPTRSGTSTLAARMRRLGTILACLAAIVVVLLLPPAWVSYGMLAGVFGLMFMVRDGRWMGVSAFVIFILILAKQIYMPWSAWLAESALAMCGILGFLLTRLKFAGRWIDDGIHPNGSGNRALATAVREAIRELNLPESVER